MKRFALALALAVAGCAHRAPIIEPMPVQAAIAASRPAPQRTFFLLPRPILLPASSRPRCAPPEAPRLPDNATAPDLTTAVERLTARDRARADYERRLVAALKACTR